MQESAHNFCSWFLVHLTELSHFSDRSFSSELLGRYLGLHFHPTHSSAPPCLRVLHGCRQCSKAVACLSSPSVPPLPHLSWPTPHWSWLCCSDQGQKACLPGRGRGAGTEAWLLLWGCDLLFVSHNLLSLSVSCSREGHARMGLLLESVALARCGVSSLRPETWMRKREM